ncbi:MAG: HrpE/YscL family type III secretion apparatus protein [Kistimonas sp.]|nr:HrpE/YscL family type III secretion apparatus protein [Kistimonas sp.]
MKLRIVSINPYGLHLHPGQKVIKAADYTVVEKSASLIASAKQQARAIRDKSTQAFEEEKRRGYEDGLAQSRMEQSEHMLRMVDQSINYLKEVEDSLANILMMAVKKIIDNYNDRDMVVGLIKSGLNHVRNERQVTVRVPPSQFTHVKDKIADILVDYKGIGVLTPVSDPRLKSGSCILESKLGVVDASVDVQLKALQKRFARLTAQPMDASDTKDASQACGNSV